jgi:hypothetical protein
MMTKQKDEFTASGFQMLVAAAVWLGTEIKFLVFISVGKVGW